MKALRIIGSPRGNASESFGLSELIIDKIGQQARPDVCTVLDVNVSRLSHIDHVHALAMGSRSDPDGDLAHRGSLGRSEAFIRELIECDCLVIATPMHNFTVPSGLKAWIDHVVRVRKTFVASADGKIGYLKDRPVFVAISSGGRFSGVAARQPDFLTPYLKQVLGTIGLNDVTFFSIEGTAKAAGSLTSLRASVGAEIDAHFERSLLAA